MRKSFVVTILLALGFMAVLSFIPEAQDEETAAVPYTRLIEDAESGRISSLTYREGGLEGATAEGETFRALIPNDPVLFSDLRSRGVEITVAVPEEPSPFFDFFLAFGPALLLVGVLIFIMRRLLSGQKSADQFGRTRARMLEDAHLPPVRFEDAAGIEEAKAELEEIVDFLRDPQKFDRVGGKIPKGVLLTGPPGTGKTLLARAIAGEAEVPFFSLSGSDFVEMYVGVGASRVRDLFAEAKRHAPCLVFIDEIDAVGRQRGAGVGGGNDEREQTLNQLLVELDGFEANEGIILIAATNRPDILDGALLRPGRFDRQVVVSRPDVRGREQILKVHARNVPLAPEVDLQKIARSTPGFSGADLANLVNEAALFAAREDRYVITGEHLERARDKVTMGSERRSMVITEREKRITACHEAGHTLAALFLPEAHPVHKVSIIPRGMALGVTLFRPEEELHNETRGGARAALCALLAGRVAEEIACGDVTSGASDDIRRATALARKMVCEWGMSEAFGLMSFGEAEDSYSESTAMRIDQEVRSILDEAYHAARRILEENRPALDRLTEALIARETLEEEDIRQTVFPEREALSA